MKKAQIMNRRKFVAIAGATISFAAPADYLLAERRGKSGKPNIVYVLTDQWRAQATGYAGDPNVKTPRLDRLAEESVNFENAVSVCPVCTPYRAALLTGRYPLSTGMFMNDLYLPQDELCMAEIFRRAGYATGYIGKWHLDGHGRSAYIPENRRQGFDYWKVLECTHDYNNSHYYAGNDSKLRTWDGYDAFAQTKDACGYLRSRADSRQPFLLFVSYGSPHFPHHTAPDKFKKMYPPENIELRPNVPENMKKRARKEAQGYYGHCTAVDQCVGELLETLQDSGLADDTIFIFTSDHGEMLGSQGQPPREKQRPWDESVLVPFLLRHPANGRRGRVVKTPLNTPDILPTLLSLASIDHPDTLEGDDLSDLIVNENGEREGKAALIMSVAPFAGYHTGKEFRGVRTERYTYVRSLEGPWLMYDNDKDPYQLNNLVDRDQYAELQKALEDKLRTKLLETGDNFLSKEQYLEKWGYQVGNGGSIPYSSKGNHKVQSPQGCG